MLPATAPFRSTAAALGCALALLSGSCSSPPAAPKTEVIVLGMIHGGHRDSEQYGLAQLEAILRAAGPDAVLTEIPPDRLDAAATEFAQTGGITESRVRVFPEYVDVLFPLQKELAFEIVPCAAWTSEMAAARRMKLAEFKETRPEESAAADAGWNGIESAHEAEDMLDSPHGIHTDRYDELVEQGMVAYDSHFNDALGLGGWSNINDAHWALCAQALDRMEGQGKRVVITFGAWHKGRLRAKLAERGDCVEVDAGAIVEKALGPAGG